MSELLPTAFVQCGGNVWNGHRAGMQGAVLPAGGESKALIASRTTLETNPPLDGKG